jgi:hypothetical protein
MISVGWARICAFSFLICGLLCGCIPGNESQMDEQKEPNFLAGKTAVVEGDTNAAVELFEKALTVNPHSSSAHYELGCLYDSILKQPADAIYHYTRHLKYSTTAARGEGTNIVLSEHAQLVQQRINSCKLEVAKTVTSLGTVNSAAQRELERLKGENDTLAGRIGALQQQLAQYQNGTGSEHGRAGRNSSGLDSSYVSPASKPQPSPDARRDSGNPVTPPRSEIHTTPLPQVRDIPAPRRTETSGSKTHVIRGGETLASIARKYAIPVNSLLAANPQVRPTHLVVGQSVVIPPH